MIAEIAPAKINLFLHVGGVRPDGLHALESLFVFADFGDLVVAEPADRLSIIIEGPFAAALAGFDPSDNLVMRAASALREAAGVGAGARLRLAKRLPVAAGVGGGSADAAATLRALQRLWDVSLSGPQLNRLAFSLGADVPACMAAAPVVVSGAGERIAAAPPLPPCWVCLVNPGVPMPTGPVFRAFDRAHPSPPLPTSARLASRTIDGLRALMRGSRNDLESPAIGLAPVIEETLSYLKQHPGGLAARLSGSGATVFGLFSSQEAAMKAMRGARARGWWAESARILTG